MTDLMELNEEEFTDEIREAIWHDQEWLAFEHGDVVHRSRETLQQFLTMLSGQIDKYADGGDKDWLGRVRRFRSQVEMRLGQAKRAIRELNREETATVIGMERKWGALAEDLATALEQSNRSDLLDTLTVRDELSVREWLTLRRSQRAAKQAKANAA
jgi:hypothetical protein